MIAASNSWVVAFDNLSDIRDWLSDSLCRVATGGGFGVREHYANDEETLFDVTRPVLLTGIGQVATKPDLLDRLIIVEQPAISDDARTDERTFWAAFEEKRAGILGALLDAIAAALRNKATVRLDRKPRMADFAVWVTAAEPALGWRSGDFMTAYDSNRASANDMALDASPVGTALCAFVEKQGEWTGTATDLLTALGEAVGEATRASKDWPKKGHVLGNDLKHLSPSLRAAGVSVEWIRTRKRRTIRLVWGKGGENSVTAVTAVTRSETPSPEPSPEPSPLSPLSPEPSHDNRGCHPFHTYSDGGDGGDGPKQDISPNDDNDSLDGDWIGADPPLPWMHHATSDTSPSAQCERCGVVMWEAVVTESGQWWWRCQNCKPASGSAASGGTA